MYTNFNELYADFDNCTACELYKTRIKPVFGESTTDAKMLFIGEAPGEKEDLCGLPFVGRGGKLLTELMEEVGLYRNKNVYITNSVKCRPPKNRDPLPCEQKACEFWLLEQIRIMDPELIVCVGRISAMKLIKKNFKIMKEHGEFFEINGRIFTAILHPAAVLRNMKNIDILKNDLKTIADKFSI